MIKIKVAIIDDDNDDLERARNYFVNKSNNKIHFWCENFSCVNEEIFEEFDVYVIDIELNEENGLKLAAQLRNRYPNAILLLHSKRNDLVFDSFKVGCFFFIRKDNFYEDIEFAYQRLVEHFNSTKKTYSYQNKGIIIDIPYENILYIEKISHNIEIHLSNGKILVERKTLKKIISEISDSKFIQCHQSYYINLTKVDYLDEFDFIIGKEKVQISKRYLQNVKKSYIDFLCKKV